VHNLAPGAADRLGLGTQRLRGGNAWSYRGPPTAGMAEFDAHLDDPVALSLIDRVQMRLDAEVDAAYPDSWIAKVSVTTTSGMTLDGRVDEPKVDPGNTLSRPEIDAKARRLAAYGRYGDDAEIDELMARLWSIGDANTIGRLLRD
jgi:2-methylcitrate dehydratase PrpD